MFILRRLSETEGVEMNFDLGRSYTVIRKVDQPNEFERIKKQQDIESDKVMAFVSSENGVDCHAVYSNQLSFIMTESGKTFAKI